MARYAQFTAESFAARTQKAPPRGFAAAARGPGPDLSEPADYGSLLVVRVGRPKKRPVLLLDPEEAATDALRFQQIAADDFANPEAIQRRTAMLRLSAMAANESGLEDADTVETQSGDPDAALTMWTNPADPVDTTDWCEPEPATPDDLIEAEVEVAVAAAQQQAPRVAPETTPAPDPDPEPPCTDSAALQVTEGAARAGEDPWAGHAEEADAPRPWHFALLSLRPRWSAPAWLRGALRAIRDIFRRTDG